MKRIYHTDFCKTLQNGAVLPGGSFCTLNLVKLITARIEKKKKSIQPLTDRRTTGQSWQTLLSDGKVAPCGFGKNHPHRSGSGIFPENLACGGSPLSSPEIGNDMFHRLKLYGHENKRVYREVENRQTNQDGGIGACCLCRIQLSVFTGNIPRMGSGSHCLLQGILQVSV